MRSTFVILSDKNMYTFIDNFHIKKKRSVYFLVLTLRDTVCFDQ